MAKEARVGNNVRESGERVGSSDDYCLGHLWTVWGSDGIAEYLGQVMSEDGWGEGGDQELVLRLKLWVEADECGPTDGFLRLPLVAVASRFDRDWIEMMLQGEGVAPDQEWEEYEGETSDWDGVFDSEVVAAEGGSPLGGDRNETERMEANGADTTNDDWDWEGGGFGYDGDSEDRELESVGEGGVFQRLKQIERGELPEERLAPGRRRRRGLPKEDGDLPLGRVDPNLTGVEVSDPVGLYFKQVAREPLLTAQEEIDLAKRIERGVAARSWEEDYRTALEANERLEEDLSDEERQRLMAIVDEWIRRWDERPDTFGDRIAEEMSGEEWQPVIEDGQAAREHLAQANTRLVISIAKRYMGQGLPFPDLIQEGNVGLMRAVDRFDYRRGNRFSTYATWWIRQAITRAVAQKVRTIRIPLHMTERIRKMYRTAQVLEQELGHKPTPEEIAEEMELEPKAVRAMMTDSQHPIALELPVGDDQNSEFGDFVPDERVSVVGEATKKLLREAIAKVLDELTPRQQTILILRFGLGLRLPVGQLSGIDENETLGAHTLEEIARMYGLSRERIRQLEKGALKRLRHPRLRYQLQDYLEV